MNLYEKIIEARIRFQKSGVKKSGRNEFAKFNYYELPDIIPELNKICLELDLFFIFSFEKNEAAIKIIDAKKPEDFITTAMPMVQAMVKGCNEVQNFGASVTYYQRYLLMAAFCIVECDTFDALPPKKDSENPEHKTNYAKEFDSILSGEFKNIMESKYVGTQIPVFTPEEKNKARSEVVTLKRTSEGILELKKIMDYYKKTLVAKTESEKFNAVVNRESRNTKKDIEIF